MKKLKYKKIWDKEIAYSIATGFILLALSLAVNYFASLYASNRVSDPVGDIVLSNVRVYDVDGLIIYLSFALIFLTAYIVVRKPKKIPFVLKSVALFIIIRSIFISLTHIGPFTPQVVVDLNSIASLGLSNPADLFFSGHTGMPFLGALIFWEDIRLRFIYLGSSIVLGICVLLLHVHYTIDVLGAFFITYTIYQISRKVFAPDWKLFSQS